MESRFLVTIILKASILAIIGFSIGCASTPPKADIFMGEGFQSSLPQKGTKVVLGGNHSGAVSRTLEWLHDHQILALDSSWIEKELQDPGIAHRTMTEQKAQVLAAAKSVGAPLVIFAQVHDRQLGRKFDLMSFDNQKLKIFGVEIRGMKTDTEDVVFAAKAWNSEPLVESEQIVHDLTTFALQKAWNEPDRAFPLRQEVAEEKLQQEEVTVLTSYPEEIAVASEDFQSESVEPLSFEKESSLGLQVAGGVLSLIYTPVKIAYAGLGGFIGGLTYILTAGNEQTAHSVWDASLHGTYWLTGKHLQGEEAIHFKGEPSPTEPLHQVRVDEVEREVVK